MILNLFKRLFLLQRIRDEDLRRRAIVLHVLFFATLLVLCLAFISVLLSYLSGAQNTPANRLIAVGGAMFFVVALHASLMRRHYFIAAYGLLLAYGGIATVMAMQWSVSLPGVSMLYGIVIVLAGMVLGAGYALYAAFISALLLSAVQYGIVYGKLHPNTSWYQLSPHMVDLAIYYLVFIVLGVCSWLFNRQTDRALHRALRAESGLQREKEKLELQVERRTHELQAAQIEKMEQLYRFAELGQFSTSLLHDLGNHMSTLTLDVEGLAEQNQHSQLQLRIKRRIQYIDDMVRWAHNNINGKIQLKNFNVKRETSEVIKIFQYNARRAHVQLRVVSPPSEVLHMYGDANRFRQLLANLILNAIDAYRDVSEDARREVIIGLSSHGAGIGLIVQDFGIGISPKVQAEIFRPFFSTKHDGMGIGLFVVRQIAEEHFHGTVTVVSKNGETKFTILLNKAKAGRDT